MLDMCIVNCRLDPSDQECSIGIENGKIVSIQKLTSAADEIIDLNGKIILPGLIDVHVHMRDPGLTYKENFKTGTESAAAGGFTTVLDMPNTKPPTNTVKDYRNKLKIDKSKAIVDFVLHAGTANPEQIPSLGELNPASFKVFMDLHDDEFLMNLFSEIADLNQSTDYENLISIHAEDQEIVNRYTAMKSSETSKNSMVYADARPPLAEDVAVSKAILMAKEFNLKVHICHASTKKSLDSIQNAKTEGCNISSEVTPHHLFLDSSYLEKFANFAKTNPPLRSNAKKITLHDLPKTDIVGTDHAPHTIAEKKKNVWNAPPGIPGLETALPLLLNQINQGNIPFKEIRRLLCENPAKLFKIENKGHIKEGMDADFVVVDMKKELTIDSDNFYSKAHYTPFNGMKVTGVPVMTILRGEVIMRDSEVFKATGNHVYS
ncbi:MAG: dihydroorotase family protein [Methanobacterium sp.]|nr:dihydroorotase family protein [Methanobacterium sp.]